MAQGQGYGFELEIQPETESNNAGGSPSNTNPDSVPITSNIELFLPPLENNLQTESVTIQIEYVQPHERQLPKSYAISCMSVLTVLVLLLDLIYCSYLRSHLCEETMRQAEHPNWGLESLFLVCQSSVGLGIAIFATLTVLARIRIPDSIFNKLVSTIIIVSVTDGIWILSEQQDGRRWYWRTRMETIDIEKIRAAHFPIVLLLQLKAFEAILLISMTFIWIRQYNENMDFIVTRRTQPLDYHSPLSNDDYCPRTPHNVTIPQDVQLLPSTENPDSGGAEHPTFGHNLDKSNLTTVNETEANKTVNNEFREKGDGHGIDTAVPRILICSQAQENSRHF